MAYTTTTRLSLRKTIPDLQYPADAINFFSDQESNMNLIGNTIFGLTIPSANATVLNTGGVGFIAISATSMLCIASITGMTAWVPFTIFMENPNASNTSVGIYSNTDFKLAGNFLPSNFSSIHLVWDGNKYYELARSIRA